MTTTELLRGVLSVTALLSLGFLLVLGAALLGGWLWRRIIRRLADHDIHGEG